LRREKIDLNENFIGELIAIFLLHPPLLANLIHTHTAAENL
jgi:hypothetical protein